MKKATKDPFLMSPTVDYCFKELLAYPEIRKGEEPLIIKWMRFLSAEAYEVLQKLSADERKRLEYEARQKAILDYNSQMSSAREEGREEGIQIGEKRGEARLNVLNEHLIKDNRLDDLKKAIVDETYREKLYEECKLSM